MEKKVSSLMAAGILMLIAGGIFGFLSQWFYVALIWAGAFGCLVSICNDNGSVVFSAVEPGLYLIQQTKSSENYQNISPFIISVPQNENGVYVYDVSAAPKMAKLAPPVRSTK